MSSRAVSAISRMCRDPVPLVRPPCLNTGCTRMSSCSISLVVKNALLREGLSRILSENDFDIQQSIDDVVDIRFEVDNDNHVVILDHSISDKSPSKEALSIINRFRKSRSVILADRFDLELATKLFSAGACAYILNNVPYRTFLTMMQLVAMGESVVPSEYIASINGWDFRERGSYVGDKAYQTLNLTDRDIKILRRLSLGLSNKIISRELGVSEATVKVSVKNIFRKLSVNNRTQAAIIAREINLSADQGRVVPQ